MKKKAGVFLIGSILWALAGCASSDSAEDSIRLVQEEEQEAYATVMAEYGDLEWKVSLPCTYTSLEEVKMAFPVGDRLITQVHVKKGDFVSRGELLAALDVEELEEQIEEQEYQVKSLELALAQTRELYEFDLARAETLFHYTRETEKDKDNLKNERLKIDRQYQGSIEDLEDQITLSRHRLQGYCQELAEGELIAPIDGEITFVASPLKDSYSRKDETVIMISDAKSCFFVVEDTAYADWFQEGEKVLISVWDGSQSREIEAYPASREEWEERMLFLPIAQETVTNGQSGTIELVLEEREHVLCIPQDALHESDQGPFVYRSQDGLLEMQYVTVGLQGDGKVEILDGLSQGDTVALKK